MDANGYLNLIPYKQFTKQKYMDFLRSIIDPAMGLHGVLGSFQYVFDLDNAAGKQLDIIGDYVGVSRVLPYSITATNHPYSRQAVAVFSGSNLELSNSFATLPSSGKYPPGTNRSVLIYDLMSKRTDGFECDVGEIIGVKMSADFYSERPAFRVQLNLGDKRIETDDGNGHTIVTETDGEPCQITNWYQFYPEDTLIFQKGITYYFRVTHVYTDEEMSSVASFGTGIPAKCEILEYDPFGDYEIEDPRIMSDEEYRLMIRMQIAKNNWDGTNKAAQEIYRNAFGTDAYIRYLDNQDGTVTISVNGDIPPRMIEIMNAQGNMLVPAGIGKTVAYDDSDVVIGALEGAAVTGVEIVAYPAMLPEEE